LLDIYIHKDENKPYVYLNFSGDVNLNDAKKARIFCSGLSKYGKKFIFFSEYERNYKISKEFVSEVAIATSEYGHLFEKSILFGIPFYNKYLVKFYLALAKPKFQVKVYNNRSEVEQEFSLNFKNDFISIELES
jgi:hypothetical protein